MIAMHLSNGKPRAVVREGVGLHSGSPSRVTLRSKVGACVFHRSGRDQPLVGTRILGTHRATTLEILGEPVSTVEHLLAACGGLGVHDGLSVEVSGRELPLLDGAARAWCEALREVGVRGTEPPLEVVRDEDVCVGESRYSFRRAAGTVVAVTIDFGDPRLVPFAEWNGDSRDFFDRIAPARTFAFQYEIEALAAGGLGAHATPETVVVICRDAVMCAGRPFCADEPARHKLLDLVGDLFLYGGPPRGAVAAHRPGHRATSVAMRDAIERGIVRAQAPYA